MSAREVQPPVFHLACDSDGCLESFEAPSPFDRRFARNTRNAAADAGWDVPPPFGVGSRRRTDFCPKHKRTGGA